MFHLEYFLESECKISSLLLSSKESQNAYLAVSAIRRLEYWKFLLENNIDEKLFEKEIETLEVDLKKL